METPIARMERGIFEKSLFTLLLPIGFYSNAAKKKFAN